MLWPPVLDGACHESVKVPEAVGVAWKFVGEEAGLRTVPLAEPLARLSPASVVATISNEYVLPALKPVMAALVVVTSEPLSAGRKPEPELINTL